jgi:hypothetical protein
VAVDRARTRDRGEKREAGGPGVGVAWRAETGRKRGPECDGGQLGRPTSAPGWWAQAAALSRNSGGWRDVSDAGG